MPRPWTIIIATHALLAAAAIVLGAFNLIRKVKGDPIHKSVGHTWATLMLLTSFSSFFIGGYSDFLGIALHALAAWTIISIVSGIYFARRGNIRAHRRFMAGSYYGLIGALIGAVSVHTRRIPSWFDAYPVQMTSVAIAILVVAWMYIFIVSKLRTERA